MTERRTVSPMPREEQETVLVWGIDSLDACSTVPSHWRALTRRAAKLGGTILWVDVITRRGKEHEVGGCVRFPSDAFSPARFGIRSAPRKAKPLTP